MFEPANRPTPDVYALGEGARLFHTGDGHAGVADKWGQPSRDLRILIDVKSTMTRILFNQLVARQSSAPLSWEARWRIWF